MTNMATKNAQTLKSPLLATPPEILLLIAESVANVGSTSTSYSLTVQQLESDNATLVNFSLSNKAIRLACISAGLFNKCTLPAHKVGPSLDFDQVFGRTPSRLTSLGIDLGNPNVWESCAHIMGRFSALDQLVLSGCFPKQRTPAFFESELATKFRSFKGTSVELRRTSLTCTQSQILLLVGGSNVTSFICLECDLSESGYGTAGHMWACVFPKLKSFMFSFPSIRRKNFVSPDVRINCILAPTGMQPEVRPQLALFEWSFGSKARNLKDRTTLSNGVPRFVENRTYFREMTRIDFAAQQWENKVLVMGLYFRPGPPGTPNSVKRKFKVT